MFNKFAMVVGIYMENEIPKGHNIGREPFTNDVFMKCIVF